MSVNSISHSNNFYKLGEVVVPVEFLSVFSKVILFRPFMALPCGHIFSRAEIFGKETCLVCKKKVKELVESKDLDSKIVQFVEEHHLEPEYESVGRRLRIYTYQDRMNSEKIV